MSGADTAAAVHIVAFMLFFAGLILWTFIDQRRSDRRRGRFVRGELRLARPDLNRSTAHIRPAVHRRWFSPGGVPCVLEQRSNVLKPLEVLSRVSASNPAPLTFEAVSTDSPHLPDAPWQLQSPSLTSFRVTARDERRAPGALTRKVEETLELFHQELASPVRVHLGPRGVTLQMTGPSTGRRGDALVRAFMRLLALFDDQLQNDAVRVIETRVSLESGHCPVCGDAAGAQSVQCTRCGTPQHGDCWSYLGRCGTYGCGERRPA